MTQPDQLIGSGSNAGGTATAQGLPSCARGLTYSTAPASAFGCLAGPALLYSHGNASDQLSSATGTSQQSFGTTYSLPANLLVAGRVIEIDYWVGWVGQSSSTQQFIVYLGGTSGAAIFTGAAVQPAPVGSGRNSMVRCLIQGDGSPGTGVTVLGSCMGGAGYSSTEASPFGSIGQSTVFPVANTNTSLAITATMTFGSQPATAATANIYGMAVIQWN